jgi:Ca2+/H+ antiporter
MTRVHNDLIICTITAVFVFGVHVSKVFTELNVRCFAYIFYLSLLFLFVYVAFIMFQFRAHGGHIKLISGGWGGGGGQNPSVLHTIQS